MQRSALLFASCLLVFEGGCASRALPDLFTDGGAGVYSAPTSEDKTGGNFSFGSDAQVPDDARAPGAPRETPACGNDSRAWESVVKKCSEPTTELLGRLPAGGACASAYDCAPVCCTCSSGAHHFQAVACICGKCAGLAEACDYAEGEKLACP